jgi:hypothetical protein
MRDEAAIDAGGWYSFSSCSSSDNLFIHSLQKKEKEAIYNIFVFFFFSKNALSLVVILQVQTLKRIT